MDRILISKGFRLLRGNQKDSIYIIQIYIHCRNAYLMRSSEKVYQETVSIHRRNRLWLEPFQNRFRVNVNHGIFPGGLKIPLRRESRDSATAL